MKVFIIDDDALSIFLTQSVLELENVTQEIQTFMAATEALEVLQTCAAAELPDVLFLDLNMPIMDGWDFLKSLHAIEAKIRHTCTIYILTSSLDTSETDKSKEFPIVAGLIHKPIASEDIQLIHNRFLAASKGTV
ncbi:MAG TPA: response regulator [Pontibacter sp.]